MPNRELVQSYLIHCLPEEANLAAICADKSSLRSDLATFVNDKVLAPSLTVHLRDYRAIGCPLSNVKDHRL